VLLTSLMACAAAVIGMLVRMLVRMQIESHIEPYVSNDEGHGIVMDI
jgi:hypothetical protein